MARLGLSDQGQSGHHGAGDPVPKRSPKIVNPGFVVTRVTDEQLYCVYLSQGVAAALLSLLPKRVRGAITAKEGPQPRCTPSIARDYSIVPCATTITVHRIPFMCCRHRVKDPRSRTLLYFECALQTFHIPKHCLTVSVRRLSQCGTRYASMHAD